MQYCVLIKQIRILNWPRLWLGWGHYSSKTCPKRRSFSNEAYASIPRIYVVCKEDKLIPEFFQRWMIENSGATEVIEIHGADHMPMFSKTQELCDSLLEIAQKYA